ncbi:MAG: ACT domain-containing protein [Lachnospiraceae bacterium]|nr:ACT domain-containing protein [Lachnospiraceae bacterium]MBP5185099.1 ACT domain-containing protein [Lachnospiraceae bacterium]
MKENKFYLVSERALPEVLQKVVEARRLLDSERCMTIQEAVDIVGISRSSFYKYKDDVLPFHETMRGKTINLMLQVDDTPGLLTKVLAKVALSHANILTIHQTIPIGGIASITLGIELQPQSGDISEMIDAMQKTEGVHYIKILGRE